MKFALLTSLVFATSVYNAEGFIVCNPSQVVTPNSTTDVQTIIQQAAASGTSVKAIAAGHSTNYIICPQDGGISIRMDNMDSIVSYDSNTLQVTVQGGAPLVKFFKDLIPLGMSVEGMVDYGAITVAGSIATGAHSSSLKVQSGVADHIIAVKLVNGLGQVVEIKKGDPDFLAVHTNLGALGILTEVTFQAVPLFKVKGEQIDLSNQIDTLPDDIVGLVQQHDYANLYWFADNNAAILHTYNKVDPATPGNGYRTTWDPSFSSIVPWVYYKAIAELNKIGTENEMCLLAETRAVQLKSRETTEDVGYLGDMYMGHICKGSSCLFPQVDDVEFAVPLDKISSVLKDIKSITDSTKICFPVFGLYVRFGLGSETLQGPTRNGPVAYVEIHVLRTTDNTPHLGFAAVDEIRQLLSIKYGAQAHYGKNFPVDFYGTDNQDFNEIAAKYDPIGLFQNNFLQSRKIDVSQVTDPQCAFNRKCICQTDDHCYPGWVCSTGTWYKDAKVCKKGKGLHCERGDECASGSCSWLKCQ
ncbi:hypothetical protein HDV06_001652 [Boothiomyces sp. JEL0866]|nr:hypothetical protein HDV06_001652 [Boothiomyces sp. JEL0866]